MRTQHIGNYFVDTDMFIEHVKQRNECGAGVFVDSAFDHEFMFGINIAPYVYIMGNQSEYFRAMFYRKFSKLLKDAGLTQGDMAINSHKDLTDKAQLLCWIFFIQDNLL